MEDVWAAKSGGKGNLKGKGKGKGKGGQGDGDGEGPQRAGDKRKRDPQPSKPDDTLESPAKQSKMET